MGWSQSTASRQPLAQAVEVRVHVAVGPLVLVRVGVVVTTGVVPPVQLLAVVS